MLVPSSPSLLEMEALAGIFLELIPCLEGRCLEITTIGLAQAVSVSDLGIVGASAIRSELGAAAGRSEAMSSERSGPVAAADRQEP